MIVILNLHLAPLRNMDQLVDGQFSLFTFHSLDQLLPSHEEEPEEEGEAGCVFYHCVLLARGGKIEPTDGKVRNGVNVTPLT